MGPVKNKVEKLYVDAQVRGLDLDVSCQDHQVCLSYFLTFHMARRCFVSVIARIKFLPDKTCKLIELHHLYSFDWLFSHFLICFIHILLSLRSNTLQHSIHSMFYK